MTGPESAAAHVAGFIAGVAMLAFGAIGVVIIGGERLVNLISPPTWLYYAFVAGGVILF